MKYIEYKEQRQHGTFDFPFALYHVNSQHPRYQMLHHWHPEFEIVRILEGSFTLQLDGKELTGTAGDSFFITGGSIHSGFPSHCHYECIVFDLDFLQMQTHGIKKEILSICHHERIVQSCFPKEMIQENRLIKNISHQLSEKKAGYEFIVMGLLYCFVGLVVQKGLFAVQKDMPEHFKKLKHFKSVLTLIQNNYSENITLEQMAASIPMNANYFCRFFREMTHKTPVQYLNYYRIESACEKLTATDKSITEIALECGFNDVSYFVKVFKKFKGITPSNYHPAQDRPFTDNIRTGLNN